MSLCFVFGAQLLVWEWPENGAHCSLQNVQGLMLFLWGAFVATTVPPLKMTCEQLEDVGGLKTIPQTEGICDGLFHIPAAR